MTKDEMKNRISMALKEPTLQQGFEIICKENAELKARLENDRDLPAIAYMQGAEKQKKKYEGQLTKAKEILHKVCYEFGIYNKDLMEEAKQFLKNDGCPDVMCEDCTKEDCGTRQLGLVEVEK